MRGREEALQNLSAGRIEVCFLSSSSSISEKRTRLTDSTSQFASERKRLKRQTKALEEYDSLRQAVSSSDSPRIPTIFRQNKNSGPARLADDVVRVTQGERAIESYAPWQFDMALLIYRGGSGPILDAVRWRLGLPAARTIRERYEDLSILVSVADPEPFEMLHNLKVSFGDLDQNRESLRRSTWTLMIDDIHIKEALRIDPQRGVLLGVARADAKKFEENGNGTWLENLEKAKAEGKLTEATEVTVYAIAPLGADSSESIFISHIFSVSHTYPRSFSSQITLVEL
jgi:hypothetical protein